MYGSTYGVTRPNGRAGSYTRAAPDQSRCQQQAVWSYDHMVSREGKARGIEHDARAREGAQQHTAATWRSAAAASSRAYDMRLPRSME